MTAHPRPRSRRPLALAIAAATAVGATALSLPALAADSGTAAAPKIVLDGGTLDWGVKESFRNYVTGMAAGTIETADGATKNADGTFRFGAAHGSYDTATHGVSVGFDGSVRFASKLHGFDIELADLKIDTVGTTGTLTADVTSAGATADDVTFASLDLSAVRPGGGADGSMSFAGIPAALTADGSKAFNGMYKAGDKLDAASLTVKPKATTPPTTPPTTTPTTPGKPPTTTPTKPTTTPTPAPPTAKPTDAAGPVKRVVDGNLDWGVKASFRSYVTSPVAAGRIETADGATASADAYRFPKGSGTYNADTKALSAGFAGSVRFLGHQENGAYSLDLKFSDLKVAVKGAAGTLTADVSSKDRETGKVTRYDDLKVATLSAVAPKAKGKVVTVSAAKAALTADGAKAFGGFYQAGAALDPVTVAVSLDQAATLPGAGTTAGTGGVSAQTGGTTGGSTTGGTNAGTTGGTLAATGAGAPSAALLGAAGLLVVAGAGATAFVARRRSS